MAYQLKLAKEAIILYANTFASHSGKLPRLNLCLLLHTPPSLGIQLKFASSSFIAKWSSITLRSTDRLAFIPIAVIIISVFREAKSYSWCDTDTGVYLIFTHSHYQAALPSPKVSFLPARPAQLAMDNSHIIHAGPYSKMQLFFHLSVLLFFLWSVLKEALGFKSLSSLF